METIIDIDTGGTFTDGIVRRGDDVLTLKTSTTPHDLTVCFSELIEQAAGLFEEDLRMFLTTVDCIRYSTTIGTNAVIERDGANVGSMAPEQLLKSVEKRDESLLRDILGGGSRRSLETTSDARVISQRYNDLAEELSDNIAVAMYSLEEERSVREVLLAEQPRHYLGSVPIHLSHELTSDADNERRLVTTLVDAYLHPTLGDFLYKAEDFLRDHGYDNPLLVFCNDGTSNRVAKTTAIRTYNSGPAAGVQGASEVASLYGAEDAVALDIGGTSADIALIRNGEVEQDEFGNIEDVELSFPMRKLYPVGGGGGTIASVEDGDLQLGPESAGANPGPACYGLGGREATVTDADVVANVMSPGFFAGDEISLDGDRARDIVEENVAEPLEVSVKEAAFRIREQLETQVGSVVADRLTNHGIDPSSATLIVYGGAGPTHACGAARAANIDRIVVPGFPSVFSAHGVGFSEVVHDYSISVASREDLRGIPEEVSRLRSRARRDMEGEGFETDEVTFTWSLNGVSGGDAESLGEVSPGDAQSKMERFLEDYEQVLLRQTARADLPTHSFHSRLDSGGNVAPTIETTIHWQTTDGPTSESTPVYDYRQVDGQTTFDGPAVLRDTSTTYAVPPDWHAEVNEYGHMVITQENS
jgi:N-methylhydantoinase A/acetophenone carboxylase